MTKLAAVLCLALILGVVASASPARRDLTPRRVHLGDPVPASLHVFAPVDSTVKTVNVVVVSRDCRACRRLVTTLSRMQATPLLQSDVVFVTDHAWPNLESLAGAHTRIVIGDSAFVRSIGLRATPTVVSFSPRSRHITGVEVGVEHAVQRFQPSPRG